MVPPSTTTDFVLAAAAIAATLGWARWMRTRASERARTVFVTAVVALGVVASLYWTLLRHGYLPSAGGFEQATPIGRILPVVGAGVACLLFLLDVLLRALRGSDE